MNIEIKDIKEDLNHLCQEYINIITKMKDEDIINSDLYNKCTSSKIDFLEKTKSL
ncbi:hypothetical protein QJR30_00015 [Paraclostridium sordellii]|uniref:hypothetical protein n=1 Tax=Paraclostridium sordellii TaxID=1505 RepID=UPI0005E60E84|nr:hypothetical protein [Paeniclostridium sordellii]CEP81512.1 Uncharacterised protein [[Clostridium] sordellii] [Paeniclostridium sordellii]